MNTFETIFTDILKGAVIAGAIVGPVVVHTTNGIAILNASEEAAAAILQLFAPKSAPATPAAA